MTVDVVAHFAALKYNEVAVSMSRQRRLTHPGPDVAADTARVGDRAKIEAGYLVGVMIKVFRRPATDPDLIRFTPAVVLGLSMEIAPE